MSIVAPCFESLTRVKRFFTKFYKLRELFLNGVTMKGGTVCNGVDLLKFLMKSFTLQSPGFINLQKSPELLNLAGNQASEGSPFRNRFQRFFQSLTILFQFLINNPTMKGFKCFTANPTQSDNIIPCFFKYFVALHLCSQIVDPDGRICLVLIQWAVFQEFLASI